MGEAKKEELKHRKEEEEMKIVDPNYYLPEPYMYPAMKNNALHW